ncbi:MAG: OmpA family protein, partial [Verrucomicrobiota bacterium]
VRADLGEAAEALDSNLTVDNQLVLAEGMSIAAKRSPNGGIVLTGTVPDHATKGAVASGIEAANPGVSVVNNLKVDGSVGTPDWTAKTVDYLPRFFRDTQGEAEAGFSDVSGFYASASGSDESSLKALESEFIAMTPAGMAASQEFSLIETPARLRLSEAGGKILATGVVPSLELKKGVIDAVREIKPGVEIDDQVTINPAVGNPTWSSGIAKFSQSHFSMARDGILDAGKDRIALAGIVSDQGMRQGLIDNASVLLSPQGEVDGSGLRVQAAAAAAPPESPAVFETNAVYFDSGSSQIKAADRKKIQNIATYIKNAGQDLKLTVGGYADSSGNTAANETLSIRRATAVRDVLVSLGVNESMMKVDAFGEEPSSEADKWKSRRVQLTLRSE